MSIKVKEKLARGEVVSMVLINYPSPALLEKVGQLGFDIAFIDCEKGSSSMERIEEMARAARACGIATIVRPWSSDAQLISRYLDQGIDGVIVAAIGSTVQAQDLVKAVQYARYADFDRKLIIGMIESPEAIAYLPQLLAVQHIDVWFIGPNDLAHRMGHPGNANHPQVRQAVVDALKVIKQAGAIGGTLVTSDTATTLIEAGAQLVMTRVSDLLTLGSQLFIQKISTKSTQHQLKDTS
ncbi:MAG: aldolase/citrate lyase family protein [Betaproteobacteria bacterium]